MSLTIDISPDLEESLAAEAAALGISLSEHLRHVLEERARCPRKNPMTPAERATFWRNAAKNLPDTEPLSDEAISRENIYADRG